MEERKEQEECRCIWVCVCGPPACGKTTLCRALVAARVPGLCVAHVEFDALLHARTAAAGDTLTPALWRACRTAFLAAADAAATRVAAEAASASAPAPHARGVVLLDDNFPLASMRLAVARRARHSACAFATVWLVQDAAVAAARNAQRTGRARVAPAVAARLARTAEPPQPARHTWERAALRVDAAALPHAAAQAHRVAAWLAALPLAPVVLVDPAKVPPSHPPPPPQPQQPQPASVAFDLWTRRVVGAVLESTAPRERPALAQRLAALRHTALRSARASGTAQARAAFCAALQHAGVVLPPQLMLPPTDAAGSTSDGDGEGEGGSVTRAS